MSEPLTLDKVWRCFHCDEVFTNPKHAAEHFGRNEGATPACRLANSEGHLVTYIRKLEAELERHRAEDSDVLRAMHAREAEQAEAVRRAEELGYNRGVRDVTARNDQITENDVRVLAQAASDMIAGGTTPPPPKLSVRESERDALKRENQRLLDEMKATAEMTGCLVVCRPGGGHEDVPGTLAISVGKLKGQLAAVSAERDRYKQAYEIAHNEIKGEVVTVTDITGQPVADVIRSLKAARDAAKQAG